MKASMASPNWSLVLKTGPVECLALQQPERDFHLVEPVVVSFVRGIVIRNHVDGSVGRLIGQQAVQKVAEILASCTR
jgi:hypothetical protein